MSALAGAALVTGASRGIGLAVAEALQGAGARVVRLARTLADRDDGFFDLRCDVTVPDEVSRAIGCVLERVGVPRIVVNNAGAFLLKPLVDTTPEEFQQQLAVNVVAPFLVTRALLPHLVRVGEGHIVTIGSIADHQAFRGNAAYGASKYGLRGLHEVLAAEVAGTGIRTSLVSPGPTDTRLWDPIDPDRRDDLPQRADMLQPEDVADAVLFVVTRPHRAMIDLLRVSPKR